MSWAAVEALATCGTAIAAILGVFFVTQQLKQVERTIRGNVQERLAAESFDILQFLASHPESYPYFYEGKQLDDATPNRIFILYAAEIIANYTEYVVRQSENMRPDEWRIWERFVINTCERSVCVTI
jgi:hypothetical protein